MTQPRIQEVLHRTIVAIGLAALLAACGGGSSGSPASESPPIPDEPITVREVAPETVAELAGGGRAVMTELLVVTDETLTKEGAAAVFARHGLSIVGRVPEANFYQLALQAVASEAELLQKRDLLAASAGILSVSLNRIPEIQSIVTPNDPKYGEQAWAFNLIEAPSAWGLLSDRQKESGLSAVKVGVIDSGFVGGSNQLTFDKLYGPTGTEGTDAAAPPAIEIKSPYTFLSEEYKSAWARHNHGMHVAGIIAAEGNDGRNVAGLAWQSRVKLYAARYDSSASVVAHLARLVRDDVRVINFSFGWMPAGDELSKLDFNRTFALVSHSLLKRKDFLMIFAAGNEGVDSTRQTYLGHVFTSNQTCLGLDSAQCLVVRNHVLIVGAVGTRSDFKNSPLLAEYSNFGSSVEIAAPGGDQSCAFEQADPILYEQNISESQLSIFKNNPQTCSLGFGISSLGADGGRILMSGTSQAAPFVSGAAALLLSANSSLSAQQVKSLLISTSNEQAKSIYGNIPILNLHDALKSAIVTPGTIPSPQNTTTSVFIFSLSCQYTKNNEGVIDPGMEGVGGVPVNITRFSAEANAYVSVFGETRPLTDLSGIAVAYLPKGEYKLSIDKTAKTQAYSVPGSFLIDPAGSGAARTFGLTLRGSTIKDCGDDLLPDTAPFSVDDAPITTLDTLLAQGGWGSLSGYNGACPAGAPSCSVYAEVDLTLGANGNWYSESWRSSEAAPFVKQTSGVDNQLWVPTTGGWVSTASNAGTYAAQPDGSVLVAGADFGPAGAIGAARVQDLAGQPMSVAGEVGSTANAKFPAGAIGYWWSFVTTVDNYNLRASRQVTFFNGQTQLSPPTLAAMVNALRSPAAGQPLGNTWGWNGLEFTFDAALTTQGNLSFWRRSDGAFMGAGQYQLRTVNGQQVLVIAQIPTTALNDAATRDSHILGEYANRMRTIFGVVNGLVYQGSTTSAGKTDDASPGLNRVALNAVLAARGLCGLPDANGNSVCPPFSVSTVTPATFTVGQVSTITVTGVSVPGTAILALADAVCGAPYGHAASGFKQDCTPQAAGSKTLTVKNQSGGTVAYTTTVNVGAGGFSVSAITPSSLALNQPTTITVSGANVPGTAVLAVADAVCGIPFGHTATGFFQTCTPQLAGSKALTVKDQPGGAVVYTSTVSVL